MLNIERQIESGKEKATKRCLFRDKNVSQAQTVMHANVTLVTECILGDRQGEEMCDGSVICAPSQL